MRKCPSMASSLNILCRQRTNEGIFRKLYHMCAAANRSQTSSRSTIISYRFPKACTKLYCGCETMISEDSCGLMLYVLIKITTLKKKNKLDSWLAYMVLQALQLFGWEKLFTAATAQSKLSVWLDARTPGFHHQRTIAGCSRTLIGITNL